MARDGSNNPDLGLTMPRTKTNEIKIKKTSVIAKAIPNDLLWNIQARLGDGRVTRHGFDVTFLAMNRKKQLSLHSLLSRMPVVTGYPRDPLASFSRKIYARYSRTTYEIGGGGPLESKRNIKIYNKHNSSVRIQKLLKLPWRVKNISL